MNTFHLGIGICRVHKKYTKNDFRIGVISTIVLTALAIYLISVWFI